MVSVMRVPADGGTTVPAVKVDAKAGETSATFPAFLSDGRHFLVRIAHAEKSSLDMASLDSSERKVVLADVQSAVLVAPTPQHSTYLLYQRDDALVAHEFDETTGEVRGVPRVLIDGIGKVATGGLMPTLGVSPRGILAYQTGADTADLNATWYSRSGEPLGSPVVTGRNPSLSSDGRWVATESSNRGLLEVWVTDLTRGVTSRLTHNNARSPVWSPDSSQVAFADLGKIAAMNADGSTEETVLAGVTGLPRSWSADGKYLLYQISGKLFLLPMPGGGTPIAIGSRSGSIRDGQLSPDGRYIAYDSDESGRDEIYLQPLPPRDRKDDGIPRRRCAAEVEQ
jgi:hypothetical protein